MCHSHFLYVNCIFLSFDMSDIDDKLSNHERGKINDQCGHLIFSLYPISCKCQIESCNMKLNVVVILLWNTYLDFDSLFRR